VTFEGGRKLLSVCSLEVILAGWPPRPSSTRFSSYTSPCDIDKFGGPTFNCFLIPFVTVTDEGGIYNQEIETSAASCAVHHQEVGREHSLKFRSKVMNFEGQMVI